jgi:hypothetical protein
MHNLFLKNMAGLIEEIKNPSPCLNPWVQNSSRVAETKSDLNLKSLFAKTKEMSNYVS